MKESTMTPKTKSEETAREIAKRIWSHESDLQDEIADEIEMAIRERDEKVTDLRAKLAEAEKLVKAVEDSSEWDDGVFYFNGKYSPEIELAINAFKASLTTLGGKGE